MWWMIPTGIAGLLALLTGKKKTPEASPVKMNMTAETWRPVVMALVIPKRINLDFCIAWIAKESGGNPCAWGSANAKGPDGHPREQGIGQLYNPDDFTRFKIPSGSLRVYCVPGSQKCSRKLTSDEILDQAKWLIELIAYCRERAGKISADNHLQWSGKDMYKLIKLWHGLPGLVSGVSRFTKQVGRPPSDWQEYKNLVMSGEVKLDSGTEKYREIFGKIFANAESVAGVLPDDVKVVS